MLRATKVRIYPTPEQAEYLNGQFGAIRFAYNKAALHIKKQAYKRHGVSLNSRKDLKPLLEVAKKSRKYAWLKAYDAIALPQAVINLHTAFDNFFNLKLRAQFPTFKRKQGKQSSYHCVGVKVLEGAVKIPKLSPIKACIHREIEGKVESITLSRTATGKYFAAILCDDGKDAPEMPLPKRIWQCPVCHVEHDRDINAAINIQRKGTTALQAAGLVVSAHGGQRKSVIKTVAA
ncbi:helix-turn-helix domain-containing protein [Photorhabdus bodei]|uniref:Helix-turn-helix domain-containing protein n=1 Tax=Photorhabdus bodei TaxID=2029681 RepID=A0A329XBS0_9GAMM|nr:helix-turn-helix domain-containing protein [Photorhabdus bodei]NDK98124.1 helix-turn-helix domain-containing protein [Photorhabdus bodei]NDL02374.1 helix-turn-helix domain-containing protein [Photorhabdus bodei]NDL06448.1 helix-turn-helix domain-containing protein [Photorhabdus bodei]RAX13102.1 transposase [Photorhabdus bodei]